VTVEPASAEPEIFGELSFAGDGGVVSRADGADGAVESSTYVTPAEQPETLPEASVAVALNVVVESSATVTAIPVANAAAVSVATGEPEQSFEVYSLTVEPTSAAPEIEGALSFAGPGGVAEREEGATGALESSTYVTEELEQLEALPATSVAVALNVVVVSSETATVRPGDAKVAALPEAAGAPEQSLVVYSLTVDPASAEPEIFGELSFAGPAGVEAREAGSAGAVESSTYVTEEAEQPETFPAASVAVALNVVELSSATATVIPVAKAAAVPLTAGAPEQSLVV
jgi:hypothetical protein